MKRAIVITGQTGTGKTFYSLALAKKIGGEIISIDARQIYKKLNIVTGKDVDGLLFSSVSHLRIDDRRVAADIGYYENNGVRMWGYDLIDPRQRFSSHDFKIVAHYILRHMMNKNSTPIVVGGSYLYLKDLLNNFDVQVPPDWNLRTNLEKKTLPELQKILRNTNEEMFNRMNHSDRANSRRVIRKIEITRGMQQLLKKPARQKDPVFVEVQEKIGLAFATPEQCRSILKKRVDERLLQGAVQEVEALLAGGYTKNDPGLQAIGYAQLISYCDGECSLEEATEQWLNAEVAYAKRQMTFMKKDAEIKWQYI